MLRRAAHALGVGNGSAKAVEEEAPPTEEALLQRWLDAGGPSAATLAAFAGTSELPAGPQPAAVRALLLRYLRAEKLDAAKAAARLEAQAVWRQGFGAVDEAELPTELASGKVKLQAPSARSAWRPLLIVKAARHRAGATPQQVNRFVAYCLESAAGYCWHPDSADGKIVAAFDLGGLQMRNLDATALRASFHMLADYFPERMHKVFMVDAPAIFFSIWKLVEPFIDKTARSNIHWVNGKGAHAALLEVVGPDTLPLEYGGTAAEVPVEVAARQLPAWRQQVLETEGAAVAEQQQVSSATAASEALERPSRALRHSESTSDLQLAI